jgi:hypothetical protein
MRALHVTLAVLLVLSSAAAGAPGTTVDPGASDGDSDGGATPALDRGAALAAAQQSDAPTRALSNGSAQNATLRVLGIPPENVSRGSLETRYVDLGPSLGFVANSSEARIRTATTVERVEAAETADRRGKLLLSELNQIEQQVIELRSRQRRAIAAFGEGSLSARDLLVRLAVIDIEARQLEARRERIERLAETTSDFSIDSRRFANLERELNTFTGPVRQQTVAVLRGDDDPARFFVQTGPNSVVLSTIANGTYVREAYRGDLRRRGAGSVTTPEALNITAQAYPNISSLTNRSDVRYAGESSLVRINHERVRLSAFIDGGTKTVFKEFQYRPLDGFQTEPTESSRKDGLRLTAYRTFPGGPVRIQLNETATGRPADALITVGPAGGRSTAVGRTGPDGTLWTMAPGEEYQVTAIQGNSVVLLPVEPSPPPLVHDPSSEESSNRTDADPAPEGGNSTRFVSDSPILASQTP